MISSNDILNGLLSCLASSSSFVSSVGGAPVVGEDLRGEGLGEGAFQVCLFPVREDNEDASLGGSFAGTQKMTISLAAILYLCDKKRTAAGRADLCDATAAFKQAVMQNRDYTDPSGVQLWYQTSFRKPTTLYYYQTPNRLSITWLDVLCRTDWRPG